MYRTISFIVCTLILHMSPLQTSEPKVELPQAEIKQELQASEAPASELKVEAAAEVKVEADRKVELAPRKTHYPLDEFPLLTDWIRIYHAAPPLPRKFVESRIVLEEFEENIKRVIALQIASVQKQIKLPTWLTPKRQPGIIDYTTYNFLYAEACVIPDNSTVYMWGDIHGDIGTLVQELNILYNNGVIDKNYSISQKIPTYFIFCGDFVDRGGWSFEVLTLLSILKQNNPDHVIFVRGNHESLIINKEYGFAKELYKKFNIKIYTGASTFEKPDGQAELNEEDIDMINLIHRFYSSLPATVFLCTPQKDCIQFMHGAFELWDTTPLLKSLDVRPHHPHNTVYLPIDTVDRRSFFLQNFPREQNLNIDLGIGWLTLQEQAYLNSIKDMSEATITLLETSLEAEFGTKSSEMASWKKIMRLIQGGDVALTRADLTNITDCFALLLESGVAQQLPQKNLSPDSLAFLWGDFNTKVALTSYNRDRSIVWSQPMIEAFASWLNKTSGFTIRAAFRAHQHNASMLPLTFKENFGTYRLPYLKELAIFTICSMNIFSPKGFHAAFLKIDLNKNPQDWKLTAYSQAYVSKDKPLVWGAKTSNLLAWRNGKE